MTTMKAPNGDRIWGTADTVPGTARGTLCLGSSDITHDGGTEIDWDAQSTKTIAGATLFVDESGNEWMQHHLVPETAMRLTDETLAAFDEEERAGIALDAAKALAASLDALGPIWRNVKAEHDKLVLRLERVYDSCKSISLMYLDRDLKAQAATVQA